MATPNLLDSLRARSQIDCDTLDSHFVSKLAPFVDCTSNQASLYGELCHDRHAALKVRAKYLAREVSSQYPAVKRQELCVDIAVRAFQFIPRGVW